MRPAMKSSNRVLSPRPFQDERFGEARGTTNVRQVEGERRAKRCTVRSYRPRAQSRIAQRAEVQRADSNLVLAVARFGGFDRSVQVDLRNLLRSATPKSLRSRKPKQIGGSAVRAEVGRTGARKTI